MLCPQPMTFNPVTMLKATCLPHHTNPSRAAGSFSGQFKSFGSKAPTNDTAPFAGG